MTAEPESMPEPDEPWRREMLAAIESDDVARATQSLVELTYNDPDGGWVEQVVLAHLDTRYHDQLRALAATCLGHVARIHGEINRSTVVPALRALLSDPLLAGRAQDALDDVDQFAPASPDTDN